MIKLKNRGYVFVFLIIAWLGHFILTVLYKIIDFFENLFLQLITS